MQHCFQQMAFGSDGSGRCSQRRIAFGDDNQSCVPFCFDVHTFNLNAADVTVMGSIEGICQTQDRGQLNRCFLFVGKQVAQSFVFSCGQRSAMEAGDDRGSLQLRRVPS